MLNKTAGTTAIAAILTALVRLQSNFPRLVQQYAVAALSRGQRVKVRPSEFVYEYEGPWNEFPGFFRLKVMGEETWRSFPLADVLRLEPTDRVRPKGSGNSELGSFERSALDQLLDLTTCGNNSVVQNEVLVLSSRTQFARVADATILAPRGVRRFSRLSRVVPWGSIAADGAPRPNDRYQVVGEPLVAVTSVAEDLALACKSGEAASKVILVDGARRLTRELQALDDIAERQRVIVLASPDESDEFDLLRDRDCPIWHMSPRELLAGEGEPRARRRTSLVGATVRAAEVQQRAINTTIECRNPLLEKAASLLERVAQMVSDDPEAVEIDDALTRLFRLLFECSECCLGIGTETADELRAAREHVERHAIWFEPSITAALREAIETLGDVIRNGPAQEKANAFFDLITARDGNWFVAARSPRTAEQIRRQLDELDIDTSVLPISAISPDYEYSRIVLPAWPNDQRFTRLRNLAVTPEIRILTYPFELKWIQRHRARERHRNHSNNMSVGDRSKILGVESKLLTPLDAGLKSGNGAPREEVALDLPVFRLEDRVAKRSVARPVVAAEGEESRDAQLVQFFGGCYALLTEWAELPLLNDLIDSSKTDKHKLVVATASDLSRGDFVLFRASGDKEFVRLIAEELVGGEEYRRLWSVAERWKGALRRLGDSPGKVQRCLADHGLDRTPATVAGWLANPDRIGPGDYNDIEIIAKAAADTELLSSLHEVKKAISQIRGAHLGAGMRLTKLILGELHGRLNDLGDQPALLDLEYGKAWVVQVQSIEAKRQRYPANQVNRLLWVADSTF